METPRNASKLADLAIQRGWIVSVTEGRGAIITNKAPEGFWPAESVAVRLRSPNDHVRAYGVWVSKTPPDASGSKTGDAKTKFDNGGVLWRQGCMPDGAQQGVLGYRELRDLIDRGEG